MQGGARGCTDIDSASAIRYARRMTYKHTIFACYVGYITQAIANMFAPLLFLTFHTSFGIPMSHIGLLVTINFGTQIIVDFLSAKFVDRIGYKGAAILAHCFSAAGLILMGFLPFVIAPYAGLAVAVVLYAVGGGLCEVVISPIVEACPGDEKEAAMSLLHSFYCWGCVGVILVSTLAFHFFGIQNWRWVSVAWAIVPLANIFFFAAVPVNTLVAEDERIGVRALFAQPVFWLLVVLMICSGASEQAMSQWASAFAEAALGITKTAGDLAGPLFFSFLMGSARVFHSKVGAKHDLKTYLMLCGVLCAASYVLAVFAPHPVLSLVGCALCGLSVGAMWPGTFSLSVKACPAGGTALFAFLALAGDIGCAGGPTLVGFVSSAHGDSLKTGLLAGIVFPLLLVAGLFVLKKNKI